MTKTAIVILNWNGIKYLQHFLPNILTNSGSASLIVADNHSSDGSVEWIIENHPDIHVITLDDNYGFAGGYNRALALIDAEYYLLLNSDIEVTPGWLDPLVSFMDEHPSVASAQPKIRSFANRTHFEYAGAAGGFIDKYGYPLCRGRVLSNVEEDNNQYDTPWEIFWSTGACMIVRSDMWRQIGGFDDDFFAHMEEIDLCWRFHKQGYQVAVVSSSIVYHVGGGTLPYSSPFKTYLNFRNNLYLLHKNLDSTLLRRTLFVRKILDGLSFFFFLLKGQAKHALSVLKAHRDYYRHVKVLNTKRSDKPAPVSYDHLIIQKNTPFEFYIKRHDTFDIITNQRSS